MTTLFLQQVGLVFPISIQVAISGIDLCISVYKVPLGLDER